MTQTIPGTAASGGVTAPAAGTISGGHLVAVAHRAEGVDTIYTRRGGHGVDRPAQGAGAFSPAGWGFGTRARYPRPNACIAGNNSSMNQIRYGRVQKYGVARGRVGSTFGDVKFK